MNPGDFLMKKWCFGVSYSKPKDWLEVNGAGNAGIVQRFPRYRTIVLEVLDAKKKKGSIWEIEANKYASLTAKAKKVKILIKKNKNESFSIEGQKRPFHKISITEHAENGMPPIGSLITLDKKHAIVTEVGRNELTVWADNKYRKVSVRPGSIRWRSDKIVANVCEQRASNR